MFKLLVSLLFVSILSSCGAYNQQSNISDKKNEQKKEPFESSWQSECVGNIVSVLEFKKDKGVIKNKIFNDNDCKELGLIHEIEFEFSKKLSKEANVYTLDIKLGKAFYTVQTKEALKSVNMRNNICDFDFKLKERMELTSKECVKKLTSQQGVEIFALFEVDGDKLLSGDDEDGKYTGESKEKRPVKINKDISLDLVK